MSLSLTPSITAPVPTLSSPAHGSVPFISVRPTPSLPHANVLAGTFTPTITPSPTNCDAPDTVVISISTAVTVLNFERIYHQTPEHFKPHYIATPDGSLLSRPLAKALREAEEALLWLGGYLVFFAWNSIAALSFIVRASVPNKSIFYVLLASQVLALVPWIIQIVTAFDEGLECQPAFQAVEILLALSSSLVVCGSSSPSHHSTH